MLLISYKKIRLKKETKIKKKKVKYEWCGINFVKDALCFLNFENHANYIISVPQYFSNSILLQNFYFLFFSSWLRNEREMSC